MNYQEQDPQLWALLQSRKETPTRKYRVDRFRKYRF